MSFPLGWGTFADALLASASAGLTSLTLSSEDPVYAVAFYDVYREYDGVISLPELGVNTLSRGAASREHGFWGERWNPPDWVYRELMPHTDTVRDLERALQDHATSRTPEHWRDTFETYQRVVLEVTSRLRDEIADLVPVTPDVVVYWFDAQGGFELASKTIPGDLQERLFGPQVQSARALEALERSPASERAAFLVTRFGIYEGVTSEMAQRELIRLGEASTESLLSVLDDPRHGWTAAKVLGQLGVASDEVLGGLRALVGHSLWHAMALGMLGDAEWLSNQAPEHASVGLTAPLRAIGYEQAGSPPPLDYRPLERWLNEGGDEARVEGVLQPGSGYVQITPADVQEALRGMVSASAVVRWHATSVLGRRELGEGLGRDRILPALVRAVRDPDSTVRRLAVLSIGRWKALAREYRAEVLRAQEDVEGSVARAAQTALSWLDA